MTAWSLSHLGVISMWPILSNQGGAASMDSSLGLCAYKSGVSSSSSLFFMENMVVMWWKWLYCRCRGQNPAFLLEKEPSNQKQLQWTWCESEINVLIVKLLRYVLFLPLCCCCFIIAITLTWVIHMHNLQNTPNQIKYYSLLTDE